MLIVVNLQLADSDTITFYCFTYNAKELHI